MGTVTVTDSLPCIRKVKTGDPCRFKASRLGFYVLFNSQDHIVTGPQHCDLWESNPHSGDSL